MGTTTWGFYGRTNEMREIERIRNNGRWFFCSISGRRRIGKTSLIKEAISKSGTENIVYLQVPDSDERGVVQTFNESVETQLDGGSEYNARDFHTLAQSIKKLSQANIILVLDEFQYFHRSQLSPFNSYFQSVVDDLRDTDKGGIFVLGSIHTEMTALLEGKMSPLFNRVTHTFPLDHLDFETLFEMFEDHEIRDPYHILFLWSLFEGVPKFYRDCFESSLLKEDGEYRKNTIKNLFYDGTSPLKDEAENWFLKELRGRYDSILKIIADIGPCGHGELIAKYEEIGSKKNNQFGGYLETLVNKYRIVEKQQPIFASEGSRKARYQIVDNFLSSWLYALAQFAQLSKVQPAEKAAIKASEKLKALEGFLFEKMIKLLLIECSKKELGDFQLTDMVRGYWNSRANNQIEVDIIAVNGDENRVRFGTCKRSQSKLDQSELDNFHDNISRFLKTAEGKRFKGWTVEKYCYAPVIDDPAVIKKIKDNDLKFQDIIQFRTLLGY